MTESFRSSFIAYRCRLQSDHSLAAQTPLPAELEDLVARLVALESETRRSAARSTRTVQPDVVRPHPLSAEMPILRPGDQAE
jgi:hypothetical protein